MLDESWDVFTKQMLVEKHISDIINEKPQGATATLTPFPPSADAHVQLVLYT